MTTEALGPVGLLVGEGLLRDRPVAAVALEGVESIRGADGEESLVSGWACCGAPEGLHGADSDWVEDCLLFVNINFFPAVWLGRHTFGRPAVVTTLIWVWEQPRSQEGVASRTAVKCCAMIVSGCLKEAPNGGDYVQKVACVAERN